MLVPVRHWYGFTLSLLTAFLWGILPVFLSLSLEAMDSPTITWYRFALAAFIVFLWLAKKRALPPLSKLSRSSAAILILATLALVINYVANVKALDYINPQTAQVLMQLAPFLLMLGGIMFYGERFNRLEKIGAFILICGMLLFFNQRLIGLFATFDSYTKGVLLILLAAITWAAYALVQKLLMRSLTAKQLNLMLYFIGAIMLLPFTQLNQLMNMNLLQLLALLFCCLNTVVAYGAFTEALHVWHASKVSAVIALSPLFTFTSMQLAVRWMPDHFQPSDIGIYGYLGAMLVVVGSIMASLGKSPKLAG